MKKQQICLIYIVILFSGTLYSQNNTAVADYSGEMYYALKIKNIDEFFDRFNFDTLKMKPFLEVYNPDKDSMLDTRSSILPLLFNRMDTTWNIPLIHEFINDITEPSNPRFINFYDPGWYAEVECIFNYKGKDQPVILVLKNQRTGYQESYWVISAVHADFLMTPDTLNPDVFMNPSVHGTNFMILSEIFRKGTNIKSFLPIGFKQDLLSVFEHEIYSGDLKYIKRENISYHFLQVDGWIFTVDYYNRPSSNAGWLVSRLIRADEEQKEIYRSKLLNGN